MICTLIFAGYPHATSSHFFLLYRAHALHNSIAIKIIQNLKFCREYTDTASRAHEIHIYKIIHSTDHVIIL